VRKASRSGSPRRAAPGGVGRLRVATPVGGLRPACRLTSGAWGAARAAPGTCASRASAPDTVARAPRRGARRRGRAVRGAYAAAGAQALSASVTDGELTKDNVSIALVGAGTPLTLLEDAELEPHLAALRDDPRAGALPVPCWGCQVRGCRDKLALRRLHSFSRDAGPAGTEAVFQGAAPRGRCAASGLLASWLRGFSKTSAIIQGLFRVPGGMLGRAPGALHGHRLRGLRQQRGLGQAYIKQCHGRCAMRAPAADRCCAVCTAA